MYLNIMGTEVQRAPYHRRFIICSYIYSFFAEQFLCLIRIVVLNRYNETPELRFSIFNEDCSVLKFDACVC